MTKIVPLGDRILVKLIEPINEEKKTKSGLYIPSDTQKKTRQKQGEVIATGKGRLESGVRVPMDIRKGNTVIFDFGEDITLDGEDYMILREIDVLAVLS